MPGFHHVELWVHDLPADDAAWSWLLTRLGFAEKARWATGVSWAADGTYLTLTAAPEIVDEPHDRRRPGLNHLAFRGGDAPAVDDIMSDAADYGWRALYADRYPHAGGPDHYAGWLENAAGFKVEIVAD